MKVALHGWLGSFGLLVLAVSTGCAFGAGSFEEISEPTKAVIYVYRPSGFYGSFVRANVYIDANVRIGALKTNSYAVAVVEPGKHTLRASGYAETLEMTLGPGSTTYIEVEMFEGDVPEGVI